LVTSHGVENHLKVPHHLLNRKGIIEVSVVDDDPRQFLLGALHGKVDIIFAVAKICVDNTSFHIPHSENRSLSVLKLKQDIEERGAAHILLGL